MAEHPDKSLIALGVRQPWAELILRGAKTIEVRTVGTNVRGPIYLYASKKVSDHPAAARAAADHGLEIDGLPKGLLVGTVEIESTGPLGPGDAEAACLPAADLRRNGLIGWRLSRPERLATPLAVRFLPYGVWFYPFQRRNGRTSPRTVG